MNTGLLDAIKIVDTLEKYGIGYQSYSEQFEAGCSVSVEYYQNKLVILKD